MKGSETNAPFLLWKHNLFQATQCFPFTPRVFPENSFEIFDYNAQILYWEDS